MILELPVSFELEPTEGSDVIEFEQMPTLFVIPNDKTIRINGSSIKGKTNLFIDDIEMAVFLIDLEYDVLRQLITEEYKNAN